MVRLTKRIKNEIESHAGSSIYRMNASSADCFVFSLYHNDKGKITFQGGWDWSKNLVDKTSERIYFLNTKEFKKL